MTPPAPRRQPRLAPPEATALTRRSLLALGAAAPLAGLAPRTGQAQAAWPQKPIRLVVPYVPGGSSDALGRLIAKHLGDVYRQTVIVENKAGAGGMVGSQMIVRAPADGYTLVVSGIGSHVLAPAGAAKGYDPLKDFTHIAMLGGPPVALVVHADEPVDSVDAFIRHAGRTRGGISWGSPGQGTHGHVTGEQFRALTKVDMTHVGYKGAGATMSDLLGHQIPAAFLTLSSAKPHIEAGKLRLLAVSSQRRVSAFPGTPTFQESGFPALTGTTWFALAGPPGMPAALVAQINAEVRRGMKTPAVRTQLATESMETMDLGAAEFHRFVAAEIERWAPIVRALPKG